MEGAEEGAVRHMVFKLGKGGVERFDVRFRQHAHAQRLADFAQLGGDGGVLAGEVAVVATDGDDADGIALLLEIVLDGAHVRVLGQKVDGHKAADGAGHLIHEAGGLAEEDVLGVLGDLGAQLGVHHPAVVEGVEHGHEHDLKGRRTGKAGALEHGAGHAGVKAAHLVAQFLEARGHAADEGVGGLLFRLMRGKIGKIDHEGLVVARRPERHHARIGGRDRRNGVQIHRRRQHAAEVVVGVVADDLRAPGGGDESLRLARKMRAESVGQGFVARGGHFAAVEGAQSGIVGVEQGADIHLDRPLFLGMCVWIHFNPNFAKPQALYVNLRREKAILPV